MTTETAKPMTPTGITILLAVEARGRKQTQTSYYRNVVVDNLPLKQTAEDFTPFILQKTSQDVAGNVYVTNTYLTVVDFNPETRVLRLRYSLVQSRHSDFEFTLRYQYNYVFSSREVYEA